MEERFRVGETPVGKVALSVTACRRRRFWGGLGVGGDFIWGFANGFSRVCRCANDVPCVWGCFRNVVCVRSCFEDAGSGRKGL